MKNEIARLLVALVLGTASVGALADVYRKSKLIEVNSTAAAGGQGTLSGQLAFKREDAKKGEAIKEIGWMTLQPGDSIGFHQHQHNEDAYIIVSGVGIFTDSDGQTYEVKAGDVTIARKGQSHGLANTGTQPLVFIDVIAEQ